MPQNSARAADTELARRIKAISNVFEVGRPEPDYAYVENLGDGRGYTVTQYGFCTYNSEVSQVIERYAAHVPDTPLKRFLPQLPPVKWTDQALGGFATAWREEIKTSEFLGRACDEEADVLYFNPAVEAAAALGIHSAIGKAIFYDTLLQHGAQHRSGFAADDHQAHPGGERRRREHLGSRVPEGVSWTSAGRCWRSRTNRETRAVWRASARRVDALWKLLNGNPDLVPPIQVTNADVDVDGALASSRLRARAARRSSRLTVAFRSSLPQPTKWPLAAFVTDFAST